MCCLDVPVTIKEQLKKIHEILPMEEKKLMMYKLEDLLWWHGKKIVDQNSKGVWESSIWIFKTRLCY
jgi:hypothetical protein